LTQRSKLLEIEDMNADTSSSDTTLNSTTSAVTETVAAAPAKAIALATTVVTSALDSLETLRLKARGAAAAGLDYGDTVARNVSAAGRRLIDQADVAAVAGLAKARTLALGALERARPAAEPAATAPVAQA
jgi:hypothetical protein